MVYVDRQQRMCSDVSDIVGGPHDALAELFLKADVHLHSTWRPVIRREQVDAVNATAGREGVADKGCVTLRPDRQSSCLICRL